MLAYDLRRDTARSLAWYRKAAEYGYVGAAWWIAELKKGGSAAYKRKLHRWLRRDADAGHEASQFLLGVRFYKGEHVRRNFADARLLFRKSANQGCESSWLFLAEMHREGEGVRRSWPRALECYRKAATGGSGSALYRLVEYYSGRCGSPRNGRALAAWVRRAEAMAPKNPSVCFFLWEHHDNEEEPSADPKRAVHWLRVGAAQDDKECLIELGALYHDGNGVRKDHERAVALYRRGVGDVGGRGEFLLGRCYLAGHGVRRDSRRAHAWFRRAAENGYIGAAWWLEGHLDEHGSAAERRSWLRWLRRDADAGDADSQYSLGARLHEGKRVRRNFAEAAQWFRKAANQGCEFSWDFLGDMHQAGEGVRRSWPLAVECYRRATTGGGRNAFYWLVEYYSGRCGKPRNGRALAAWVRRAEAMAPEHPSVCFFLGEHYCNEEEPSTDPKRAVHWLRVGAAQGDEQCLVRLGLHYRHGYGVQRDRRRARASFRTALREGSGGAARKLAKLNRELADMIVPDWAVAH